MHMQLFNLVFNSVLATAYYILHIYIYVYIHTIHYINYHPELLLGSRGLFPDNGKRGEAKHALNSNRRTWILNTAMSNTFIAY